MNEPAKIEVEIWIEKGKSESLLVTPLGSNFYRLEESTLMEKAHFQDAIEAVTREDGSLEFLAVKEHSTLQPYSFLLSKQVIESGLLKLLLDNVKARNGFWEILFGSLLFIYLPEDSDLDPDSEINKVVEQLQTPQ